jgi:MYXO-CTERM domain-containing protein
MKILQIAVLGIAGCAALSAGSINFDDQPTGPGIAGSLALGSQYLAQGVLFTNMEVSKAFAFNVTASSSPTYATPFWTNLNPGSFQFIDPNSMVDAYVNSVSFTLLGLTTNTDHPGNFSGATIQALDLLGNVITGDTQVIPGTTTNTSNVVVTFTGQVHEILFTQTPGTSGIFPLDDLNFSAITTPEPGSLLIAAGGLLMLLGRRRRR